MAQPQDSPGGRGPRKPPIGPLIDAFSDEFGDMAGPIVEKIRGYLDLGMDVRTAVNRALTDLGVGQAIADSILDKVVKAAAIGFGIDPRVMVDPVGARRTFLNHHWDGDKLNLSQRIARAGYRHVIVDAIQGQMQKARSWQQTAAALTDPMRKGGGPDLVQGDVTQKLDRLARAARTFAPDDPAAVRAFQAELAAAKAHVRRLGRGGAPNQTLKTAYGQVIAAAEALKVKAMATAIQQAVRDKARYNAERIARTEMARAYAGGWNTRVMADTDVVAVRVMLSTRHPEPDICNFHTQADLYGMGPGVFPKGTRPGLPFHPHCLCLLVEVFEGEVVVNDKMDPKAGARYLAGLPEKDRKSMLGVEGAKAFKKNPGTWSKSLRGWEGHPPVTLPNGLTPAMFRPDPAAGQLQTSKSLEENMATMEARLRPQRFESAAAFDEKGNMLLFKDGKQYSVEFTREEQDRMRNSYFTHNHPRGWGHPPGDPRHGGNSFSLDDIRFAANLEMKEIRAASPLFDHSMRPGPDGWDRNYFEKMIEPSYKRHKAAVKREDTMAIRLGKMTLPQAEARFYHEVWKRVVKDTGLVYRRTKI